MYKNSVSCSLTDEQLTLRAKRADVGLKLLREKHQHDALIPIYSDSEPAVGEHFHRNVVSTVVHQASKERDNSILNMRKGKAKKMALQMSLCTAPSIRLVFRCFHYRINKVRHSPNLAPLFSDCESSTHTIAFYNLNTIQDLKKRAK